MYHIAHIAGFKSLRIEMHFSVEYIYIYQMLSTYSAFRLYIFFYQYVCSLGIEPTTFWAANAMLYHWAPETLVWTGIQFFIINDIIINFNENMNRKLMQLS